LPMREALIGELRLMLRHHLEWDIR